MARNVRDIFTGTIKANITANCGIIELDHVRTLALQLCADYNASAASPAVLQLFYSPDGQEFDSVVFDSWTLNLSAGSRQRKSKHYDLPEQGFLMLKIQNQDSTYDLTNVRLIMSQARHADVSLEADKYSYESEARFRLKNRGANTNTA